MGKKSRHKNKEKFSLPLIALISGAVILLGAVVIFSLQRGSNDQAAGGTPAIAVDQEMIDYGDVKLDTPLTFKFKVTNTGDGDLRFSEDPFIEVIEGC